MIGVVVVVAAIVTAFYIFRRRRRQALTQDTHALDLGGEAEDTEIVTKGIPSQGDVRVEEAGVGYAFPAQELAQDKQVSEVARVADQISAARTAPIAAAEVTSSIPEPLAMTGPSSSSGPSSDVPMANRLTAAQMETVRGLMAAGITGDDLATLIRTMLRVPDTDGPPTYDFKEGSS